MRIWFTDQLSKLVDSLPLLLVSNSLLYSQPCLETALNIWMLHMLENKYVLFNVPELCMKTSLCVQHWEAFSAVCLAQPHFLLSAGDGGWVESADWSLSPGIPVAVALLHSHCHFMPFSHKELQRHSNNSARLPARPFSLQKQISHDHQFQLMIFKNGSSSS